MADIVISPGLNTVQTAITGSVNASGDRIIMQPGTYTVNTAHFAVFDSGATGGPVITEMTVMAQTPGTVIWDCAAVTGHCFYPGDAARVTIKDITITNFTSVNGVVRDAAGSAMTNWTFDGIVLDNVTDVFFERTAVSPGVGITIKNITTTANFAGKHVIEILGPASNLDMSIKNIDARLHVTSSATIMEDAIKLTNVRDVRLDGLKVYQPWLYGLRILSADLGTGVYDVDVFNVEVDGGYFGSGSYATQPGIHVGIQTSGVNTITKRVRVHGAIVKNNNSYGIEFEGGVEDSEIVNCRITNVKSNGIPIPDSTKNILVADNTIDGVTGAGLVSGVAMVYGQRHRVYRNTISNVYAGIRVDEAGDNPLSNERNFIRDNIFYNTSYAYSVDVVGMPQGVFPARSAISNKFGPNTVFTPTVAYALVDDVAKTQAQFELLFPDSIEVSDTVIASPPATILMQKYSIQQALNILAGNFDHPYIKWSAEQAANILLQGSSAGNLHKYSGQEVFNLLV